MGGAVLIWDPILQGIDEDVLYGLAYPTFVYGQPHVYGLAWPQAVLSAVQGIKLLDELDDSPGYLGVGGPELHPIQTDKVVVLLYVLAGLPERDPLAVVDVALVPLALIVVLLGSGHETALCYGDGRVVCGLAEVGRYHVLHAVFHRASSPS